MLGLTGAAAALELATGLELVLELTGSEAATGVELLVPFHTAGPGNGKVLYPLYMLKFAYSSVSLYAPGNFTRGPGLPLPPSVTLTCAQET